MEININDNDPDSIELTLDGIPGVEPILTIHGVFEPGQKHVAPSCRDSLGQEGKPAEFEITRVEVYVTEEWQQKIELCHVADQLKAADFYNAIINKIEEGL